MGDECLSLHFCALCRIRKAVTWGRGWGVGGGVGDRFEWSLGWRVEELNVNYRHLVSQWVGGGGGGFNSRRGGGIV